MIARFLLLLALCFGLPAMAADSQGGPEWRYTIRPGDTLIGIGKRYLANPGDWKKIQQLNKIGNTLRLPPAGILRIPFELLSQQPAPAKVSAVSGQVHAVVDGVSQSVNQPGLLLPAGSEIGTAADSSATLVFADGSHMTLYANSSVQMDTVSVYTGGGMADTRLRLKHGRADFLANPDKQSGNRMQVITPSAIAAVRGTVFRVASGTDSTREETIEGKVGVEAEKVEVSVETAMGTRADAGKPPSPPVALPPAPDLSALPARFDRYPLRFSTPGQNGVVGWVAQISPDTTFQTILLEKEGPGPILSFASLPDGKYVLRMRGVDANGLQGLDAQHAFEVDAHPFPPLPIQPGDQANVRTARPQLGWTSSVEAERYHIQIAHDADFRNQVADDILSGTQYQPASNLAAGPYFWRLASIGPAGDSGPYSDPVSFTYKPLPGAPVLDTRSLRFDNGKMNMNLPGLPDGLHYEIKLARDDKLTQLIWQGSLSDFEIRTDRPTPGTYYLAARAVESDGTAGPYTIQAIQVPDKPIWPYFQILLPFLLI